MKVYLRPGAARLACPLAGQEDGHIADLHFIWQAGSEHAEHHGLELTCSCGQGLRLVSGDDPWESAYAEIDGEPHGA